MDNNSNLNNEPDNSMSENSSSSEKRAQDRFPSVNLTVNTILIAGGVVFAIGAYHFFGGLLGV